MIDTSQLNKINFRSIYYCGLGTWKKKDFYPAVVRKRDLDFIHIVTMTPSFKKIFLRIPVSHFQDKRFEVEQRSTEFNCSIEIDSTSDESLFIWEEYIDREAIKQINQNKRALS